MNNKSLTIIIGTTIGYIFIFCLEVLWINWITLHLIGKVFNPIAIILLLAAGGLILPKSVNACVGYGLIGSTIYIWFIQ